MTLPIAYVCADPGIAPDGDKGASVHFRSLAAAFARAGVELDVFMARDGDVRGFRPHRARVVPTPRARGVLGEVLQLGHAEAMQRALAAAGPHGAVYERLSLFGLAGLAHARTSGIPLLVEVNSPLWREAAMFRDLALPSAAHGVCLDVLRGATRIFAVSSSLAAELAVDGIDRSRIEVLGNGAELAAWRAAAPAEKPPALRGRPTLLFAGSLKPWHGIPFLLRGFAALRAERSVGLWIVGDGPERDEVAKAQRAFPGDIVHEGAVPHERMPGIVRAADVVVAPYPAAAPGWFSPLKIVEALAAGRPLLASRVPCVLETLEGHAPLGLFDADDLADFVAAARRVIAASAAGAAGIDPARIAALDWSHKVARILEALHAPQGLEAARG